MHQFIASVWTKDEEITTRIRQVSACPTKSGDYPLYELENGERHRHYPWSQFETLHDSLEAAELWIADKLEGFASAYRAKAEEMRHAAAERSAAAQITQVA